MLFAWDHSHSHSFGFICADIIFHPLFHLITRWDLKNFNISSSTAQRSTFLYLILMIGMDYGNYLNHGILVFQKSSSYLPRPN